VAAPPHETLARQMFEGRPVRQPGLPGVHLNGLHLDGGAVLLLPATPDPDDVLAILAAARPLLDVLSARGLLANPPRSANPRARANPPGSPTPPGSANATASANPPA